MSTTDIPLGTETYQLVVIDPSSNASSPATANVSITELEADLRIGTNGFIEDLTDPDDMLVPEEEFYLWLDVGNAGPQAASNFSLEFQLPPEVEVTDLLTSTVPLYWGVDAGLVSVVYADDIPWPSGTSASTTFNLGVHGLPPARAKQLLEQAEFDSREGRP